MKATRSRPARWRASVLRMASLALLVSMAACGRTPCEELKAEPIAGKYRGGATLGEDRLLEVGVEASSKQVVLSYRAKDGSRIRAFYRVSKKVKK